MPILRKEIKNQYTVIDQSIFYNKDLSYKAKGLLCQMLSLPDDWDFSIEGLAELSTDGRSAVSSALDELKEAGYFCRRQIRNGNRIAGVEYVVSESPNADFLKAENLIAEKLIAENQRQSITNISITNKSNTNNTHKKGARGNLNSNSSLRPTLEEVREYIREKDLDVDAERFFNFFEAGDWIDSKGNPVRNWKQKLITWSNNNGQSNPRGNDRKRGGLSGSEARGRGDAEVSNARFPRVAYGFQEEEGC